MEAAVKFVAINLAPSNVCAKGGFLVQMEKLVKIEMIVKNKNHATIVMVFVKT